MKIRDFSFRAFDTEKKSYVDFEITSYGNTGVLDIGAYPYIEIELWSGFYDSKGTKIYEGDIVKYDSRTTPLVAVFERSTFYIVDTSIEKHLQVDCGTRLQGIYENGNKGYINNKLECVQVLGNIHENAELLKGGRDE